MSKTKVAVIGSGYIGNLNPALQPAHRTQVAVFRKVERADQPRLEGLPG